MNINFTALGGIEEKGKNLYVIEVNDDIFVLDSGIKYADSDMMGVDMILPNIEYLIKNRKRVKGIFITSSFLEHFGSVLNLLKEVDTLVYGSKFTINVIKSFNKTTNIDIDESKLVEVNANTSLKFGVNKVSFFNLPYTIPGAIGVCIHTKDGNIVYTGCYNFDQNTKIDYQDVYFNLVKISNERVLLLLTQAYGSDEHYYRGTIYDLKRKLENIINNNENRIIISCYSYDLDRIQKIIDIAEANNKKIVFATNKLQYTLINAMRSRYLRVNQNNRLDLIKDSNKIKEGKDVIVLVCGNRKELFGALEKMATGADRKLTFKKTDTFISLTNPYPETEKIAAHTFDVLSKNIDTIITFSKDLLPPPEASREDMKQMLNILKPKYVIPVIGEYLHLYNYTVVAECVGYTNKQVIITDLGDVHTFKDQKYIGKTNQVNVAEVMIDGDVTNDIHDYVIRDRKLLADSGIVIVSLVVNAKTFEIKSKVSINLKGITFEPNEEECYKDLNEVVIKSVQKIKKLKQAKINDLKSEIKEQVAFYIFKKLKLSPIICPAIFATF